MGDLHGPQTQVLEGACAIKVSMRSSNLSSCFIYFPPLRTDHLNVWLATFAITWCSLGSCASPSLWFSFTWHWTSSFNSRTLSGSYFTFFFWMDKSRPIGTLGDPTPSSLIVKVESRCRDLRMVLITFLTRWLNMAYPPITA